MNNKCHSLIFRNSLKNIFPIIPHSKYGFRPFDDDYNYNKILLNNYNKNIEIINNITIEKANILKYIELIGKKQIIDNIIKFLEIKSNMSAPDIYIFFLISSLVYNVSIKDQT
jgi:hypothetical protein